MICLRLSTISGSSWFAQASSGNEGFFPTSYSSAYKTTDNGDVQAVVTGNFVGVGACSTGRHEIKSDAPFGLWVWGWGTPAVNPQHASVSYGYPAGMTLAPLNSVPIQ